VPERKTRAVWWKDCTKENPGEKNCQVRGNSPLLARKDFSWGEIVFVVMGCNKCKSHGMKMQAGLSDCS
jgi:hypothetical protein